MDSSVNINSEIISFKKYLLSNTDIFKDILNNLEKISCKSREAFKAEMLDKYKENKIDPNYMDYFERYYTPAFTYKALNRLIQGSAADMTKKAMVDLHEKGIVPHIQIHDELCFSIKDHEPKLIQSIMEKTIPLEVKNKVDFESGPNWGTIK